VLFAVPGGSYAGRVQHRPVLPLPEPLTTWQSTWRYLVTVSIGTLTWLTVAFSQWRDTRPLFWVDLAMGVAGMVLVHWRRRWPLGIALVVSLLSAVSAMAVGAMVLATISMATWRRWRWILPVAAVNLVASMVYFGVQPNQDGTWLVNLPVTVFGVGVLVAIGLYVGARRELVATLRDRAERAEREQTMRVAQARTTERARIAREMHDVLAHRLSLVAMHAGALSYRSGLSEQEVAEAADVIRSSAHQALTDLREVLGVLREAGNDPSAHRPQPTLCDVPSLVEEVRGAGTHVRLHNGIGDLHTAPEAIGRSAYRVIQESLTNARKHAPDTTVDVGLHGSPGGELALEVRNPVRVGGARVPTPGAGLGLIGLTERAELTGGRLEHELTDDGEFVVRAWLPWPA
jgi:signal transduction histidine kinase